MKKITNIFLIAALICSMTFMMTACGDTDASSDDTVSEKTDTSKDVDVEDDTEDVTEDVTDDAGENTEAVFPAALEDVEALPIPDLSYTGWALSGGIVDGQEMEETDVQEILDACGGCFNIIFSDNGNVTMENGAQSFPGTYTATSDEYFLDIVFENYEYYGAFTDIEGVTVMILANKADSETAFYMTTLEEK